MSSDRSISGTEASGSADVAISVRNVSKCYHIYDRPLHRLLQGLVGARRTYYREFWALHGVTFDVQRGETLGIIGRNGSGKSTLLQLIAGTLAANEGDVAVNGRVAALLELGSGFNAEFTGRENVYLNASILGLSKTEIDGRFDQIAEFADIGSFIDQPVKSYSSGMVMRLAFSVIVHVDADVLIIDEALAVGDAFFTQKCMRFLREFKTRGTLLFVSHDGAAVTGLCDRAIWLDGGVVKAAGIAKDVMAAYTEAFIHERQGTTATRIATRSETDPRVARRRDERLELRDRSVLRNDIELFPFDPHATSFGESRATISHVALVDRDDTELGLVFGGEEVALKIDITAQDELDGVIVGFYIKDRLGQLLFGDNTHLYIKERFRIEAAGTLTAVFRFEMPRLQAGEYFVTAGVAEGDQSEHVIQHWIHEALKFRSDGMGTPSGLIGINMLDVEVISEN
ncbi:lipopolysaccharide transport system ATP-binding protein [Luteibacter sp. UNCMF331Sha3.1]|uniref:ABC transporter ATP-binding protein n=1 Tax=Luteibacter sp. UNCMF331Sha3.1 TaxID=1502760 RepID=UPI0008CB21C3|nr:ABC transporter ATP-binding protein [Luteibacter sp. UNCMF331Sha3.1]SEM34344.1 lipopolysaccharide transport system ATP-binding protein [Luteibacter sp. UNCMF331Sha3.1]